MHRSKKKRNKSTTTPNLWDSVKAVLRGRFIAIQVYLKTQDKHQINNITLHQSHLEKEKNNPQVIKRKEILKNRAEINEKEIKDNIAKINKTKSCFFEKINKIGKPLARLPCFPGSSDGKASACNAGDPGSIPGLGRSPGEGNGNPFLWAPKSLQMVSAAMKLKDAYSLEGKL